MTIAYVIDEVFEGHRPPASHPERPERLHAIRESLKVIGLEQRGHRLPVRAATEDELGRVHTPGYLADLTRRLPGNTGWLDADTYYSAGTWESVLAAAAAGIDASAAVLSGRARRAVAAVRPPGHHAEADIAMGFCIINNVAVAAAAARAMGAARVAIVDWDVHHGNGTQAIFYRDPDVLFSSLHQYPLYPGTGSADETGDGPGLGATLNVPLPPGCGDAEYLAAFDELVAPALRAFGPDLILVSAGFDAHADDPLASMELSARGYLELSRRLCRVADDVAGGRVVAMLEGGYDLGGLGSGVTAMVEAMAEPASQRPRTDPETRPGDIHPAARAAIEVVRQARAEHGLPGGSP